MRSQTYVGHCYIFTPLLLIGWNSFCCRPSDCLSAVHRLEKHEVRTVVFTPRAAPPLLLVRERMFFSERTRRSQHPFRLLGCCPIDAQLLLAVCVNASRSSFMKKSEVCAISGLSSDFGGLGGPNNSSQACMRVACSDRFCRYRLLDEEI